MDPIQCQAKNSNCDLVRLLPLQGDIAIVWFVANQASNIKYGNHVAEITIIFGFLPSKWGIICIPSLSEAGLFPARGADK